MCTMSLQNTSAISTKNCGKTVGNNPAEQGTIPHFLLRKQRKTSEITRFRVYIWLRGWDLNGPVKNIVVSALGRARTRYSLFFPLSRSLRRPPKPTPSSGGRGGGQFHLSVETKENRPNRVCFFCLASQTEKDISRPLTIFSHIVQVPIRFL